MGGIAFLFLLEVFMCFFHNRLSKSTISQKKALTGLGFFFIVTLSACATLTMLMPTTGGVYHTVGPGEDLFRISRAYDIEPRVVAELNRIYNPNDISTGDEIFIPGVKKVLEVPPPTPEEMAEEVRKGLFIWPVEGMIYSLYGPRWGRMHYGVDISAPRGTPIVAAADGYVVISGRRNGYGGYGITVEIKHDEHYSTVYAHLCETMVKEGDKVRAGEKIGLVGSTGRSTGPHCHFEVRYDGVAMDPLFFLP